jgi:hypothetical protein
MRDLDSYQTRSVPISGHHFLLTIWDSGNYSSRAVGVTRNLLPDTYLAPN